jgi:hypothetical protein
LTRGDTERLLDTCQALLEQQGAIAGVLGRLGPTFRETRAALNARSHRCAVRELQIGPSALVVDPAARQVLGRYAWSDPACFVVRL